MTNSTWDGQGVELPRPPGAIRRLINEHPDALDIVFAAGYFLAAVALTVIDVLSAGSSGGLPDYQRPPAIMLVLLVIAVTVAALLLRRRHALFGLIAVLLVLMVVPDEVTSAEASVPAVWVLLYSVAAYRSAAAGWLGYLMAAIVTLLPTSVMTSSVNASITTPDGPINFAAVASAVLLVIPVVLGSSARNRRLYTEAIIARAEQLARERDQLARLAVAEERSRIAREMHDVVAHSLSVMITLAEGASRVSRIAPDEGAEAMRQCAETGRTALGEMRRLLGALREPDEADQPGGGVELAPAPGIDALPELIERFDAAGLRVDLQVGALSAQTSTDQGRGLAVYRIVQEALTNTLRHAGQGAAASVRIDERDGRLLVAVVDDGGAAGRPSATAGTGTGQGLAGLVERVRVFGGELDFGPGLPRGWRLTASLPTDEKPYPGQQRSLDE